MTWRDPETSSGWLYESDAEINSAWQFGSEYTTQAHPGCEASIVTSTTKSLRLR